MYNLEPPPLDPYSNTKNLSDEQNLKINFKRVSITLSNYYGVHWHNCIQFSVIKKGSLVYTVNQTSHVVSEGQGFFVNYGCLHKIVPNFGQECEYFVINFDPDYLIGAHNEMEMQKFMTPYLSDPTLDGVIIKPEGAWQTKILARLWDIENAFSREFFGYELAVRGCLCEIWLEFISALKDRVKILKGGITTDKERIKMLIHFIRLNYMRKITLSDIAANINVSTGECCRLFKRTLQTSPIEYLNRYRIEQSIKLLLDTRYTILHISGEVGFGSVNHYISLFSRYTNCTPKEFRKKSADLSYIEHSLPPMESEKMVNTFPAYEDALIESL